MHVVKKLGLLFLLVIFLGALTFIIKPVEKIDSIPKSKEVAYWFILHRKSNMEYFYNYYILYHEIEQGYNCLQQDLFA